MAAYSVCWCGALVADADAHAAFHAHLAVHLIALAGFPAPEENT